MKEAARGGRGGRRGGGREGIHSLSVGLIRGLSTHDFAVSLPPSLPRDLPWIVFLLLHTPQSEHHLIPSLRPGRGGGGREGGREGGQVQRVEGSRTDEEAVKVLAGEGGETKGEGGEVGVGREDGEGLALLLRRGGSWT